MPEIIAPEKYGSGNETDQVQIPVGVLSSNAQTGGLKSRFFTKGNDNKAKVDVFLIYYPQTINLLKIIEAELLKYFPDLKVYLENRTDPETGQIYLNVAIARNGRTFDEAFNILQRFIEEWWANYDTPDSLLLNITLEHSS